LESNLAIAQIAIGNMADFRQGAGKLTFRTIIEYGGPLVKGDDIMQFH
jgi:hypothetical protein